MTINKKKIGLAVLVIIVVIQFFRIDKENPAIETKKDFIAATNPPINVSKILKTACYDCHSHETTYPWYSNVAPVSWWVKNHINDGRKHFNFSLWTDYDAKKRAHKLEEFYEEVEEGEMPLNSYTWVHAGARLSSDDKNLLINWVKSLDDFKEEAH
ncbi:MAG: heme-binding domain-containing protein [Cyclobacteriaceae bacterium]